MRGRWKFVERVHDAEPVGRVDKQAGPLAGGVDTLAFVRSPGAPGRSRRLQRPDRRRADGDDAPTLGAGAVDRRGRVRRNLKMFLVHPVLREAVRANRLKRAEAHIERHARSFDAPLRQTREDCRREVEARGRGRDGPIAAGIDGLVVRAVQPQPRILRPGATNVRRQGRPTDRLQERQGLHVGARPDAPDAALAPLREFDLGPHVAGGIDEAERLAQSETTSAREEHFPLAAFQGPQETTLDAGAAGAAGGERRRDHPRLIQHHQVVRPQKVRQFAETPVRDLARPAVQDEQASRVARPGGFLRDAVGRQIVIEIRKVRLGPQHGRHSTPTRFHCAAGAGFAAQFTGRWLFAARGNPRGELVFVRGERL